MNFKSVISTLLVVLILIVPVSASSVKEIQDKLNLTDSQLEEITRELSATQKKYESIVAESEKISNEIQANNEKITKINEEVEEILIEIPQMEEKVKSILKLLQKNNNVNYLLQILFSNDSDNLSDKVRTAASSVKLTNSSYEIIVQLTEKHETLVKNQEELEALNKENEKKFEEAEAKSKELLALINEQEEDEATLEAEKKAQKAQKEFLEKAGCKGNDVYGVDCGVPIKETVVKPSGSGNSSSSSGSTSTPTPSTGFRRPLARGVVTNEYGGYDGYGGGHNAIDVANSSGTPIYATADGVVIDSGYDYARGIYASVIHNVNGTNSVSTYWHMSTVTVSVGQSVTSNTQVGAIGSTGISTGPHLHFGLDMNASTYSNARAINPRGYVSFPSKGVWWSSR